MCKSKSTFYDEWKLAKTLSIPKTNNEFRPNAILPFLSKVLENIIAREINRNLESHMEGRSCTTTLLNVVENLMLELDGNSVASLDLLNHTEDFDTVNHKILLNKLRKLFNFSNSAGSLIFVLSVEQMSKS